MIRLEESIRELKQMLKQKRLQENVSTVQQDINKPYHVVKADEKIEELTRATAILAKAKDKDQKVLKMQKKMFDKNTQELNLKITQQEQLLKDKDKELKLQALKIKELLNADNGQR